MVSMKKFFKFPDGTAKRSSILISRVVILLASYGLTYASDNVSVIFNLGGGLFSPFLSYIMPVMWARSFDKKRGLKRKQAWFTDIMDYLCYAFGVVLGVVANYYGFQEAINGDLD